SGRRFLIPGINGHALAPSPASSIRRTFLSFSKPCGSDFTSVPSLLPRSVVKPPTEFGRSPARFFSTTQYQYDPYTGEDLFTPDNEGCDFNHWLITMDFPKENPPSREEMISIFEQTCAKGLGISLEEAKKKIYAICTTSYQGFQATMTIGEVEKFRDLAGVQYIIPDSYVDVENKVYGGDKYENGVITPGPVPVPTKEGFDSLEKESTSEQETAQRSPKSTQVQSPPEGTLDPRQGQGSRIPISGQGQGRGQGNLVPNARQGQGRGQRSQMPSFQGSFKQSQGTPTFGQRQGTQGNQIPSFHGSFKQGQGTESVGQGQGQGSKTPSYQIGYSQGQSTQIYGQGQGQGSQIPSYQIGYSQGQGAQTPPCQGPPSNYGQGALANYNQRSPQGTQENYNQMGSGNYIQQSGGNYGPVQGIGSPGFGHGQGHGGPVSSPYQGSYNQGQGTTMPVQGQGQGGQVPSYQMGYSQGLGAPVPPYQVNYNQGTPSSHGQWVFVNPPHGNFLQGPQQNYNQGGQWSFRYGPPQFGNQTAQYQLGYNQWQCQGCGMISYLGSYNQGQGTPNPGQWQGQGCAVPSYQASYSHSQGATMPPHQGNYGQGTSASLNQGVPVNYNQTGQGNYNLQSGGNYGSAGFPQEDKRNVAGGDWSSNNNNHRDQTEAGKIPH
ncbi:unnamed protein product, partial [Thlaspi arvense]